MKKVLASVIIIAGLFVPATFAKEVKVPVKKVQVHKTIAVKGEFITKKSAVLRDKPARKGKIVAHLKKGEKVSVQWCDKYSWCKLEGKKEFISREVLRKIRIAKK